MKDKLAASEALYGFAGWLVVREEKEGEKYDANTLADLVFEFCEANGLKDPRINWATNLVHPDKRKK